jgi:hypothetical protein
MGPVSGLLTKVVRWQRRYAKIYACRTSDTFPLLYDEPTVIRLLRIICSLHCLLLYRSLNHRHVAGAKFTCLILHPDPVPKSNQMCTSHRHGSLPLFTQQRSSLSNAINSQLGLWSLNWKTKALFSPIPTCFRQMSLVCQWYTSTGSATGADVNLCGWWLQKL